MPTIQTSTIALVMIALCGCVAALLFAIPARASPPPVALPREVLTFYYGWYGTPSGWGQWRHWQHVDASARWISNTTNYPAEGVYDSHSDAVIDRQLRQMRNAGITGVIVSWWGPGTFEDLSLDRVARQVSKFGLKLTAYYETLANEGSGMDRSTRVEAAANDISSLLDRHGHDPTWLRVAGRPVLFVFARAVHQLGPDGWRLVEQRLSQRPDAPLLIGDTGGGASAFEMRAAFAGIHSYNDSSATAGMGANALARWSKHAFAAKVRPWSDRITCITIFPGFDNRKAASSLDPTGVTSRNGGRTLATLGRAAIASRPDWLLLTSWNEWHEGTEIEPSDDYGDEALDEVRWIAQRFLALPTRELPISPAKDGEPMIDP